MSKANLQKMGQLEFPKSSLTIFCCFNIHGLISRSKREFRGNSQLVGKTNISFLLCANSKNIVNLWGKKISSEYWNKRILLIIKMDLLNQNQREGLKNSLTNFYCFLIHVSVRKRTFGTIHCGFKIGISRLLCQSNSSNVGLGYLL